VLHEEVIIKPGDLVIPCTEFLKSGFFNLYLDSKHCGKFHIGEIGMVLAYPSSSSHMVKIYTCGGVIGNIPRGNLDRI
jgi:hypothetical protein